MSNLFEEIQAMQRRLADNARNERAFVDALGEALNQVDQHLLAEVRRIGDEHEARRSLILHELQGLAARLCLFPAPNAPMAAIESEESQPDPAVARVVNGSAHAPGDWRRATSAIQDEPGAYWRSGPINH